MEKLRTYLKGRKKAEFAESIGITPSYLSQILATTKRPSYKLMVSIRDQTKGEVPLDAWVENEGQQV